MDIILTILLVLGVILIIAAFVVKFKKEADSDYILGLGSGILISILIIGPIYLLSIPPIDVYRGKTTLEITYKDNIPIDSVVVYKTK